MYVFYGLAVKFIFALFQGEQFLLNVLLVQYKVLIDF